MADLRDGQTACQRRLVGHRRSAAPTRTTQAPGWSTPRAGPGLLDRHHLCAEIGHSLGAAAPRVGLWLRDDLLAPAARLAGGWGVGSAAPRPARPPRRGRPHRLEPRLAGLG